MSEPVQAILDAARRLTPEQFNELRAALGIVENQASASERRRQDVEMICGKYRDVRTSSEEFLSRKRDDLGLES